MNNPIASKRIGSKDDHLDPDQLELQDQLDCLVELAIGDSCETSQLLERLVNSELPGSFGRNT
jgi:hypothetical protein